MISKYNYTIVIFDIFYNETIGIIYIYRFENHYFQKYIDKLLLPIDVLIVAVLITIIDVVKWHAISYRFVV